jgi:uncharacterized membrane protein
VRKQEPQFTDLRSPSIAPVVERNIRALLSKREAEEERLPWYEKLATVVTDFTGSIQFVAIHLVAYGAWILINIGWLPILPKFDPTFVVLAMVASVEAIFLSTFILMTQNRMMAQADRRADLNLQISLLAEHEVTRLITLTKEIATRLNIDEGNKRELEQLEHDVAPEQMLDVIEEHQKQFENHE